MTRRMRLWLVAMECRAFMLRMAMRRRLRRWRVRFSAGGPAEVDYFVIGCLGLTALLAGAAAALTLLVYLVSGGGS